MTREGSVCDPASCCRDGRREGRSSSNDTETFGWLGRDRGKPAAVPIHRDGAGSAPSGVVGARSIPRRARRRRQGRSLRGIAVQEEIRDPCPLSPEVHHIRRRALEIRRS